MASKMFVELKNNSNPELDGKWEITGTFANDGTRTYVEVFREGETKKLLWVPSKDIVVEKTADQPVVEEETPAEEDPV